MQARFLDQLPDWVQGLPWRLIVVALAIDPEHVVGVHVNALVTFNPTAWLKRKGVF